MAIQHKNIPDSDIHEPKGINTTARRVYMSNGAGSGSWEYVHPEGHQSASEGETYIATGIGGGNFEFPGGRAHAEIYISNSTTPQTLAAAQAYTRLSPTSAWQDGEKNYLATAPTTGVITLTKAGTYLISFWADFYTASISSGASYKFKYAINGVPGSRGFHTVKNTAGVDHLNVSATGLITVAANHQVSIYVAGDATSSGTAITIEDAGFQAIFLAE